MLSLKLLSGIMYVCSTENGKKSTRLKILFKDYYFSILRE